MRFQRGSARRVGGRAVSAHLALGLHDRADLCEEPAIVAAGVVDFLGGEAGGRPRRSSAAGRASVAPAPRGWRCGRRRRHRGFDRVEAGETGHGAQRLLQDLGKVRPIAIASPTDFMEVVRIGSAPGNFSKVKRGILVTT